MDPICSGDVGHAPPASVHPCARRPVPASVQEQRRTGVDNAISRVMADLREEDASEQGAEVIVRINAPREQSRRA